MEGRFGGFDDAARSRHRLRGRDEVATAVGGPNGILVGAGDLPGHLITACCLLGTDRSPATKFTDDNGGTSVFQRGTRSSAGATATVEEKISPNLDQTCRALRLNHGSGD